MKFNGSRARSRKRDVEPVEGSERKYNSSITKKIPNTGFSGDGSVRDVTRFTMTKKQKYTETNKQRSTPILWDKNLSALTAIKK